MKEVKKKEERASKVLILGLAEELKRLKKRMNVSNLSKATIKSYARGLEKITKFSKSSPRKALPPYLCPKCQMAEMVVVEVFHGIRGSPMRYARPLCHRHKPAQFTSFIPKDKKVKLVV